MRRISDLTPTYVNGELVFVQRGLGDAASTIATANSITAATSAASSLIPNKPVNYQSDFSKVSSVVATGAAAVASVAVFFVPAGPVVAAVAGVVAVAATLLGKVFANSKAKAYAAERKQYEEAINSIKSENFQLDESYAKTKTMVQDLKNLIKAKGLGCIDNDSSDGLGICIIGCKAKKEKARLENTKDDYEYYSNLQQQKIVAMQNLLDEYNKLMAGVLKIQDTESTNQKLLLVGGGIAALAFIVALYKAD